jgi:hypothetical protein
MTYRAVLSEPTIVLPGSSDLGVASAGTNGLSNESQNQLNDRPPAKRPHEPDNEPDNVARFGSWVKEKEEETNQRRDKLVILSA